MLFALGAAAEAPRWPPPEAEATRMRELQSAISAKESTPEQREAARRELATLLKSPTAKPPSPLGESRGESRPPSPLGEGRGEGRPPRAAIQPFPSITASSVPTPSIPTVDPADVAKLEVVSPPRAIVNPSTGAPVMPLGSTIVDTRTGRVFVETPSGYMDPVTGRLIPR